MTIAPHIGIVGAGVAGLRCADMMLQKGFRVTVLEARDRVGGRLHQAMHPSGHLLDMGPNWIHGTQDSPIYELAKKTGTVTHDWEGEAHAFNENGEKVPNDEAETLSTVMWTMISEAFEYSRERSERIDAKLGLSDFLEQKVLDHIPGSDEEAERTRKLCLQMTDLWGLFVGTETRYQSLKFFWLEEMEDNNVFVASTYQKILQAIAKPVLDAKVVQFGAEAAKIMSKRNAKGHVHVETSQGKTLDFDEVIVTSPLGWLKQHQDAFEPALPSRLTKAIDSVGYGCLEKVYISFNKAFWKSKDPEEDIAGFCGWVAPKYAAQNPKRWFVNVVEFGSFEGESAQPTLLFYSCGDQSRHLVDAVYKLNSQEEKDDFLYDYFKPYYSRLPGYDANSSDCQPTGTLSTSWLKDGLAGNGSYSNFQVALEDGAKDIETMREGLPERGLWFAGEHTSPFSALGTVTGAYHSGEAVAKRIAERYKDSKAT